MIETLSLVEEDDQITHLLSLGDDHEAEEILNVFQADDDYLANEEKYKEIKAGQSSCKSCKHFHFHLVHTVLLSLCRNSR